MFACPRCNYNTKRKNHLNIHFSRKKGCKNLNNVVLNDEIKRNALENKIINNEKHENLYEQFCKHIPKKQYNNEKRKLICGKAIKAFEKLKYENCLENIPEEINVDKLLLMIRCLLNFPSEYKNNQNPADLSYNIFNDGSYYPMDKPLWLSNNEFCILSHLVPMIRDFEKNTLKMMCANDDENNHKINKRLHRLYKLILCLDIDTITSHLDVETFVNEILDVGEDQTNYSQTLVNVKNSKVVHICKIILENAKEELKSEEDDKLFDILIDLKYEFQQISELIKI